jgi:fucose permease
VTVLFVVAAFTSAGSMAERYGVAASIVWGGLLCVVGVALCVPALPAFWRDRQGTPSSDGGS